MSAYSEAVARLQAEEASSSSSEQALPEHVFQAEMKKLREEEERERWAAW